MAVKAPSVKISKINIGVLTPGSKTVYANAEVSGSDGSLRTKKSGNVAAVAWSSAYSGLNYQFYYTQANASGEILVFKGDSGNVSAKQNIQYSAPDNAITCYVYFAPVANSYKHYKKKNKSGTTTYNTAVTGLTSQSVVFQDVYPEKPTISDPTINNLNLNILFTTTDTKAKYVRFRVYNGSVCMNLEPNWIELGWQTGASVVVCEQNIPVAAGGIFRIQAQTRNDSEKFTSEWSDLSGAISSNPFAPTNLRAEPYSSEGIKLDWGDVPGIADTGGYEIQYVKDKELLFDSSTVDGSQTCDISEFIFQSLEPGYTYFFRVRAKNSDGKYSGWSNVVSQILAVKPKPPSTWTLDTVNETGSNKTIYFTHNSADNSKMTAAVISYKINNGSQVDIQFPLPSIVETTTIFEYDLPISSCIDGDIVLWKVKTKGAHADYSDYSIERTIKVYSEPSITIDMPSEVESYPITVELATSPQTQIPLAYSISINSVEGYDRINVFGESEYVAANQELYSKTILSNDKNFTFDLLPNDCKLDNGQSYKISVIAAMNSGFNAETAFIFEVNFDDDIMYTPVGGIEINDEDFSAYISAECYDPEAPYEASVNDTSLEDDYEFDNEIFEYKVLEYGLYQFNYSNGSWYLDGVEINDIEEYGLEISSELEENDFIYISYERKEILDDNASMSIYRYEATGEYTEIATGITNNTLVFDPHPNFGICEYRIVAINDSTGSIGFSDIQVENNVSSVVIQWDEEYKKNNDDVFDDSEIFNHTYMLLELPYNIKVSENNNLDSDLVEFIGRKHPVSYYGTQQGSSINISSDIPKDDEEKIKLLRKLSVWPEDVYIREPNGNGYWAKIEASWNIDYSSLIIPVSINTSKVESNKI